VKAYFLALSYKQRKQAGRMSMDLQNDILSRSPTVQEF
jgi:hypothetical protein